MGLLDAPVVPNSSRFREQLASGRTSPLLPYYSALGGRNLDVLFIGDSMTEGHGASTVGKRWVDLVRDDLRARYQPAGIIGGIGYVPAWYASTYTATPTTKWTWTGSVTNTQGTGLGKRVTSLNATGASGSMTFTGTSLKLLFTKMNAAANSVSIQIDGGTAYTYTDPRTSGGPTVSGGVWNSVTNGPGALAAGSHTVTITWASGQPFFEGAMVYNGDEASGIRVWDAAHFGYLAPNFGPSTVGWFGAIPIAAPALTVIALGTNDFGTNGATPTQFNAALQQIIAGVRTYAARSAFVILMQPERTPTGVTANTATYAQYVAAAYDVAAADTGAVLGGSGATVLDLTKRVARGDTDPFGTRVDGVHFSDKGNRIVADALLGYLNAA